jgi:diaminopropionate ammonia-lyase
MAMRVLRNPLRGIGLPPQEGLAAGAVSRDPAAALSLWGLCPAAAPTPLQEVPALAAELDVAALWLKDERERMGLGSFKALGAVYAIADMAARRSGWPSANVDAPTLAKALAGSVFACASAGNHGLSVAAGARLFGARAVVYLSDTTPDAFERRLRRAGAEVRRIGADYAASMAAAARDAERNGWMLLSDSSWPGYTQWPLRVMEGYLVAGEEVYRELPQPPSHILLQAGVGGFAAAMTALFRRRWGDGPIVVVVEPEAAATLMESVRAAAPVTVDGPVSIMGRLDCKEPSHLALSELAREADAFVTISDAMSRATVSRLEHHGIATTPSGAAGVCALHHAGRHRRALGLRRDSRVLAFITEGPEEPA